MDVINLIRPDRPVIDLIRSLPGEVVLVRPTSVVTVRLTMNRGPVIFNNGNGTAETLPIATRLSTYYQLKKQS